MEKGAKLLSTRDRREAGAGDRCSSCPLPNGPEPTQPILQKENTQRPIFSLLPVFSLGKPCYKQSESGQATSKVLPRGERSEGGGGGSTLLLRGSALKDCGLPFRGKLGAIPGGGHPKQGGLGTGGVSGPCHFSVYHLSVFYYPVEFK